jgi:hypothetical protein
MSANDIFPPMAHDDMLRQPTSVWRCVEQGVRDEGRYFGAKQIVNPRGGNIDQPGWLTEALIEPLHAWDVPIAKLFTACAIAQRAAAS